MGFWSLTLIFMNVATAQRLQKWKTAYVRLLLIKWADTDLGQNI